MSPSQTPTGPIRRAIRTIETSDTYRTATDRLNAISHHTPDPTTVSEAIQRVKLLQQQLHYTWAATGVLGLIAMIGLFT